LTRSRILMGEFSPEQRIGSSWEAFVEGLLDGVGGGGVVGFAVVVVVLGRGDAGVA